MSSQDAGVRAVCRCEAGCSLGVAEEGPSQAGNRPFVDGGAPGSALTVALVSAVCCDVILLYSSRLVVCSKCSLPCFLQST